MSDERRADSALPRTNVTLETVNILEIVGLVIVFVGIAGIVFVGDDYNKKNGRDINGLLLPSAPTHHTGGDCAKDSESS